MFGIVKKNPMAFALAVVAHIMLIVLLFVEIDWFETEPEKLVVKNPVIQAIVIDGKNRA